MKKNMLYCGMANDISTPLILPIHWDTLYVMDMFDEAYSSDGTLEGQKKDIIRQLVKGHNQDDPMLAWFIDKLKSEPSNTSLRTEISKYQLTFTPCKILKDEDVNGRWHLEIEQSGKIKNIIVFHNYNFCRSWPSEIRNIDFLTAFGAVFPLEKNIGLNQMIQSRCTKNCTYFFEDYFLSDNPELVPLFDKVDFPVKQILSCSVSSHLPLLKHIFVDDPHKNDSIQVPSELLASFKSLESKKIKP